MMHPYATNSNERYRIPLGIAAVAFLVAWGISTGLRHSGIGLPFWVEVPSTAGLYGLGYELFKYRVWRWRILSWLGWVRTPIIDGDWTGVVRTSFDAHASEHAVTVDIKQNWTEISVRLRSAHSGSHSTIGAVTVDDDQGLLSYEYINEPLPGAIDTMHTHRGTARLAISADRGRLEGEYYSGRDRENQGLLVLERSAPHASK